MTEVTILALNVNGLSTDIKRFRLCKLARENKVDVLVLTETHKGRDREKLISDKKWKWVYESRGTRRARGTAILIHERVSLERVEWKKDNEGRWVFIKGVLNGQKVTVAAIYAPNVQQKQFIMNVKSKLDNFKEGMTVLAGDFNIQMSSVGGNNKRSLNLSKLNMVDLHSGVGNRSTYYSARHNVFSCIDYILMDRSGNAQVGSAEVKPMWLSDHAPLLVKMKMTQRRNPRIWRYNMAIVAMEQDKKRIQEVIKEYYSLNDRGEISKAVLWDCGKAVWRGHLISLEVEVKRRWRRERENKIKEIVRIQDQLKMTKAREWYRLLKQKKKELEQYDEMHWNKMRMVIKQRISSWGIKSTKQLARYLKKRKEKSYIRALRDTKGELKEGNEEIERIMKEFYEKLYKQEEVSRIPIEVGQTVDEEEKNYLNAEIRQEEVERVIRELKKAKSPGPDGYSGEFYKTYIQELLPYLTEVFNEVLTKQVIPQTWKVSEIITIPKVDRDETNPESYRPISLANQDYKIFVKVLANRLEGILPKIIMGDQFGFVKGRRISEPIRNVMNVLHHATAAKRKLGILKLDVYKAFDKVNHSYLYEVCKKLNLGEKFCETIKGIYMGSQAYIRVNGNRTENIRILNGTKQGCPLSPMLFVMAIETLANKIRAASTWEGYRIGEMEMKVNLFADDAILVTQTPLKMVKAMKETLQEFEKQSGLKVNMEKSEMMFINTGPREQIEVRKVSGLKLGVKRIKYLGVWIYKNIGRIIGANYGKIWKKILKQMKGWKQKGLRRMAKIRAVKMMILPKFLFLAQALPGILPGEKIKEWDRKLNYWVEGGKKPRIRKKWLIANEKEGGWGIPSLETYRDAFQIERLLELQEEEKRWAKLEKEVNAIGTEELIFRRWGKSEVDKLIGPMRATMEVWRFWQRKLAPGVSKVASLEIMNPEREENLNRIIKILREKGVTRLEQLVDGGGRIRRERLENWLGERRWLQIRAISDYLKQREVREALQREDTEFEKIIRERKEGKRVPVGRIYDMLISLGGSTVEELTTMWERELQVSEAEMERIVGNIAKLKNTRVRETRRKILHKWHRTPAQLTYLSQNVSSRCWHGCRDKGVYMHMLWECEIVHRFWKVVEEEVNRALNIKWTITKEMVVLVDKNKMGEYSEMKTAMIESAQAVVVLGWKDSTKWTIENWLRYMVEHIQFEIMETRENQLHEDKLRQVLGRWDRVRGYITRRTRDQTIMNKLELLFKM